MCVCVCVVCVCVEETKLIYIIVEISRGHPAFSLQTSELFFKIRVLAAVPARPAELGGHMASKSSAVAAAPLTFSFFHFFSFSSCRQNTRISTISAPPPNNNNGL